MYISVLFLIFYLFQVEAYDAAILSCLSVLDLQPENVKALFRLGKVS